MLANAMAEILFFARSGTGRNIFSFSSSGFDRNNAWDLLSRWQNVIARTLVKVTMSLLLIPE
jgi:hypothetical protein